MAAWALSTAASINCWGTNWWMWLVLSQTQLSSNSNFLSLLSSWARHKLYITKNTFWRRMLVLIHNSFCWSHFSQTELWQFVFPFQQCNNYSHSRFLKAQAYIIHIPHLQCMMLRFQLNQKVSLNCTKCKHLNRGRACQLEFVQIWKEKNLSRILWPHFLHESWDAAHLEFCLWWPFRLSGQH